MCLLYLLLCICAGFHNVNASARCEQNAQLNVFKKSVEQKGFHFEKLEVNRSNPIEVVFSVVTSSWEVDSVSWKHNGEEKDVEDKSSSMLYYSIDQDGVNLKVTLHIILPSARSTGEWTMTLKTSDGKEHSSVCTIGSPPILRQPIGAVRANQGESLSVTCQLESTTPYVRVDWKRLIDSPEGQRLTPVRDAIFRSEDGVENAVMEWKNATEAGGFYLCTAQSARGSDSALIEVRIKNMGTYLWPCVGIAAELVVLIISIAVYERGQYKKRKAEASRSLSDGNK